MPFNQAQFLFLFTFTATLGTLIFSAHFLESRLRAAGYDIRNIILIGLDKKSTTSTPPFPDADMSIVNNIQTNVYAQVFAVAVVVTTGLVYRKFVATPAST